MKDGGITGTYMRQTRNILAFGAVVLFLFVLKAASEVTLPIALALFIFAFANPLMDRLSRLKVPNLISIILVLALVVVIFFGFIYVLILMVNMLLDRVDYYAARVRSLDALLSGYLADYFPEEGEDFSVLAYINVDWYGLAVSWLTSFSSKIISIFSDAMMIFVTLQKFSSMLGRINRQMSKYLLLKAIISLLTGLLFYLTAVVTGLDFALVWGVLSVLMNFIPTIGSIIVTSLTILMAVIQFAPDAWINVVYVIILTVSIEMVLGNIIDPRLQGVQLNMSPLMILISLSLWGFIWGLPGMFLAVPIMSIIQIVCAIVPPLKPVAVLLSSGKTYVREYRSQEKRMRRRRTQAGDGGAAASVGDIILPEGENPRDGGASGQEN